MNFSIHTNLLTVKQKPPKFAFISFLQGEWKSTLNKFLALHSPSCTPQRFTKHASSGQRWAYLGQQGRCGFQPLREGKQSIRGKIKKYNYKLVRLKQTGWKWRKTLLSFNLFLNQSHEQRLFEALIISAWGDWESWLMLDIKYVIFLLGSWGSGHAKSGTNKAMDAYRRADPEEAPGAGKKI